MDLISIIVPVYNVEKYINRCVESIINQSYTNLEIILINDGSTDNCPIMCDKWAIKDKRVKVIHKENGGLSDARNVGLNNANGKFIAFVDSDDWVHYDYISSLYHTLIEYSSDISACDISIAYEGEAFSISEFNNDSFCCYPEDALRSLIQGKGFRAVVWNKLYKKELLINEYFEVGKYHEDEFFTYRIISKAQKLSYTRKTLYYYFQRSGSIMNSFSVKHLDSFEAQFIRIGFLKNKYPSLYLLDKVSFVNACIGFYQSALGFPKEEKKIYISKIKLYRKKIDFEFKELKSIPIKDFFYITGSAVSMHLFCKLLLSFKKIKRRFKSE